METETIEGSNPLCSRCQKTPFASLFATPQREVILLTLKELWSRAGCRFCDLLKHTLTTHYGEEYMQQQADDNPEMVLYAAQSPVDPRCDWNELYVNGGSGAFYLGVHGRSPKGTSLERVAKSTDDEFNESWCMPKIQLLRQDGNDWVAAAYGKTTLPDTVDFDYVRDWIDICDKKHARAEVVDLSSVPMLAVDVHKMCVVPMPPGPVRYIALSYMWGKDQPVKLTRDTYSLLTTEGEMAKTRGLAISRTIRDAIRVTGLLGYRYIWVDALCIVQDDPQHLRANVGAMDKVYAAASLTIVAAAGHDADGGLPGVYPDLPRAEVQMRVDISQPDGTSIIVGNMLDSAKAVLNFSTWDTRGWTYQERALSHRLLSFSHSQVYFYCDRGCSCREDLYPLADAGDVDAGDNAGYELSFDYDDLFTLYASATARYTQRQLTNPADKVNAFQGLLNRLSGPFRGPFLFGLPSTTFDVGLLWEPAGPCKRGNLEFPSWTWAGWDGPVRYDMKDSMTNLCECILGMTTVETSNGVQLCGKSDGRQPSLLSSDGTAWKRWFDEDTLEVYYSASNAPLSGYRYPRPLAPAQRITRQQSPIQVASTDFILHIRGPVAPLIVSDQHSPAAAVLSKCRQGTHTHCRLQLHDSAGRVVGYVLVDGREVRGVSGEKHRFLALSRSTLRRMDNDPSWDPKTRTFRSWTHPESGALTSEEDSSESDEDPDALWSGMLATTEFFDAEVFNPRVFWPTVNVLMVSERRADGTVERVGVGKVHVDGFMPIAEEEDVLLG